MKYHQQVTLITGKGTYTIFNLVKKYLNNEITKEDFMKLETKEVCLTSCLLMMMLSNEETLTI